jgi:hypothetical protein
MSESGCLVTERSRSTGFKDLQDGKYLYYQLCSLLSIHNWENNHDRGNHILTGQPRGFAPTWGNFRGGWDGRCLHPIILDYLLCIIGGDRMIFRYE